MSLPNPRPSAPGPAHPLVADQLGEMELVLRAIKSTPGLDGCLLQPGKRLRPTIFLLSNRSARAARPRPRRARGDEIRMAAAIELIHEASLVHDDLVDRSATRRGQPTLYAAHGEDRALLLGDLLLLSGVQLLVDSANSRSDLAVARLLAAAGTDMVRGELDQLERRDPERRSMAMHDYLAVVSRKTARFFAACAEGGATLAGASPRLRTAYRRFGHSLGVAFQMADDIADATGDPRRATKPPRHDAVNGVVTLPMIHAHQIAGDHPAIAKIAAGTPLAPADQDALYLLLADDSIRHECLRSLEHHLAAAGDQLGRLPASPYRRALADVLKAVRQSAR